MGFDDVGLRFNVAAKLTTTDSNLVVGALTDNGTNTGEVALAGNLTIGGANQNNTYSGDITGTGNFTKVGSGTMTLSGTNTFSGAVAITGGTLAIASSGATAIPDTSPVTVGPGATFAVMGQEAIGSLAGAGNVQLRGMLLEAGANGDNTTFSGVISNNGPTDGNRLSKRGTGTLTLAGASTFSSAVAGDNDVSISDGAISVADVANQGISSPLGAGDRLGFSGAGNARLIFTGGGTDSTDWRISLISGGTVDVSSATGQLTLSGPIFGTGALTKAGSGALLLTNTTNNFSGNVRIVDGSLSVPGITNSGVPGPLGAGNAISLGGGVSGFGRLIITGGSGSSNRAINLGAGSVIKSDGFLTLTGFLSGPGDLTTDAPFGILLQNAGNSFSGDITALRGDLLTPSIANASVSSPIGAGSRITLGGPLTQGALSIGQSGSTNRQIEVAAGGGRLYNYGVPVQVTLNGAITGAGPLEFSAGTASGSTFELTGANTRTGTTSIGFVKVLTSGGSGLPDGGRVELFDNAADTQLQISVAETIGSLQGGAGPTSFGRVTLDAALTLGGDNTSTTYLGLIDGAGTLTKVGTGTLTLTNAASSFTGGVTIADGAILVSDVANSGSNSPLGAGSVISLGGGAVPSGRLVFSGTGSDSSNRGINLGSGSAINIAAPTGSLTLSGNISGSGDLIKEGPGALFPTSPANSFTGNVTVAEGTLISLALANSGVASSLGAGTRITLGTEGTTCELVINGVANSITNRQIDVANGGNGFATIRSNAAAATTVTLNGAITGFGPLVFAGNTNDLFVLTGANTYTGIVFIDRVKVQITGGSGLPDNGLVELVDNSIASLQIDIPEVVGALRGGAGVAPGRIMLNAGLTVGAHFTTTTYSGVIEGLGSFQKVGASTLFLTNNGSSFSGGVTIAGGSAISISSGAISGANSPLGSNGTITFGDATASGRLIVTGSTDALFTRPFVFNPGGAILEISPTLVASFGGTMSGSGGLTKTGLGQATIVGDLTYTGPTIVQQGALFLDGSIAGALDILGGGSFDTVGTCTTGPLSLSGGKLGIRQNNRGVLVTGNLTFQSGELELDLNNPSPGQFDRLNANGAVSFTGAIQLVLELFADPVDNLDIFDIIQNNDIDVTTLANASAGFVYAGNLLEDGERFSVTTGAIIQLFEIRYGLTPADNDVRLLAVPEPGSGALLLLGLGLLAKRGVPKGHHHSAQGCEARATLGHPMDIGQP